MMHQAHYARSAEEWSREAACLRDMAQRNHPAAAKALLAEATIADLKAQEWRDAITPEGSNRIRRYLPLDYVRGRYPRLIRAMRWAACLADTEAAACIQMWLAGHPYAGEAVNHYGGTLKVLLGALRCRHAALRDYGPIKVPQAA